MTANWSTIEPRIWQSLQSEGAVAVALPAACLLRKTQRVTLAQFERR